MRGRRGLVAFRTVRKNLKTLGIGLDKGRGKGSHWCFIGPHQETGSQHSYPIPKHQQKEINPDYVKALRQRFDLTDKRYDAFFQ